MLTGIQDLKIFPLETNKTPGDYEQDGLLYCGNCHTPKQCRIKSILLPRVVPCMCECQKATQRQERDVLEQQRRAAHIRELREIAFPNSTLENFTFSNAKDKQETLEKMGVDITEIMHNAANYVRKFEEFEKDNIGLLFHGSVGTGKTFVACCIANALLDRQYMVIFKNFSDISNELFGSLDKSAYMKQFSQCSLLILDDFSMERDTQYMNEVIFNVIDTRYRAGKPLIITTNIKPTLNTDLTHQRIYSRISEMCIPIKFKQEDIRQKISVDKRKRGIELLK